jgi:hypothetical protein
MNEQTIDIERVVREVLAALGAGHTAVEPTPASTVQPKSASSGQAAAKHAGVETAQTPAEGDLAIDSRVVAMGELTGRLASVRRLIVSRNAIVTPAVQDELLRRNIALVLADATKPAAAVAPRLAMISSSVAFDPAALIAVLKREGFAAEHTALNCLIASTEQLAAELAKPDTLGLLLTPHVAAGLCLANRLSGVRAITGGDVPAVAAAAAAVGANLLVLAPRSAGFFQLKQMVTEFCRGGVRPCPEVFRRQLG